MQFFSAVLISILLASTATADSPEAVERHIISALVYQFTKLIQWPDKSNDFVIYAIEDSELASSLTDVMADKSVASRKIRVESATWASAVLKPADIVIFPKKGEEYFKPVIEKLKHKPCLIVGFSDGLAKAGASINFFLSDDKVKFELNPNALKENSLKVDPTLLKLAKIVQ